MKTFVRIALLVLTTVAVIAGIALAVLDPSLLKTRIIALTAIVVGNAANVLHVLNVGHGESALFRFAMTAKCVELAAVAVT